jgi:lipopolysaccharide heptosyltransferase II
MEIHALDRGLMLLEALGIPRGPVTYDLPVGKNERRAVDELLSRHGIDASKPLVAINPVAKWETKLWSQASFARLADRLIDRCGARVVFTGIGQDRPVIAGILSRMAFPAVSLAGETSLKTLAALYRRCRLLISTDTGPMHLGCAVGTPVIALFGPTAPWRTGPYGERHRVIRTGIACSPCFKRTCPIGTGECMRQISAVRVFEATEPFFPDTAFTVWKKLDQDG